MTMIPIFIHIHEKSDEEIQREWNEKLREYKLREEEEAKRRKIEEDKRLLKQWEEEQIRRKLDTEYDLMRTANPWDFQFLPEGWSIFGTPLKIVEEY